MTQHIVIHSQRMAGWLIYRCHNLIKVEDDMRKPGYKVYVFGDNARIRRDMSEYIPYKAE